MQLIDRPGQTQGKLLTVLQNRRSIADFGTLQELLAKEKRGRAVEVESHSERFDQQVPES